jgi:hypothetical protein
MTTTTLTRAEAAYAHLATFQRGDYVDITGECFFQTGTITQPQRPDGDNLESAYLLVGGAGTTRVTVAGLLGGLTITTVKDATAGNIRYFDEAGYTMQNAA